MTVDVGLFNECRLEGDYVLSSGRKHNVLYDFSLLSPTEVAQYVEQLVAQIPSEFFKEIDFVACPALGGIIPGFLVSFAKNKPLLVVDKQGKVRGPQFKSGKYLIVDDVVTRFTNVNLVRSALSEISPEFEVAGIAAYIFRGSRTDLDKQGCPLFYLARKEQVD